MKMEAETAVFDARNSLPLVDNNNLANDDEFSIPEDFKWDEDSIKLHEQKILETAKSLADSGKAAELAHAIKRIRPFLNNISKAKATKLVRRLVDMFLDMEASTGLEIIKNTWFFDSFICNLLVLKNGGKFSEHGSWTEDKFLVELCQECINWAKQEKRTYLRQSLEARLIALYYDVAQYAEALHLGSALLKELKKMDDKNLLVEVQLLESKVYHSLTNFPKARAALTTARTTANGIYCAPKLQAALDLQSGILHAAEEKDFKTAFSYFYEAFEGYDSVDNPKAIVALKYMLLSKVMLGLPDDVQSIVMGKLALKYAGPQVDAMVAVAKASHQRSLADFQEALKKYHQELIEDPIIRAHLDDLYDTMLEQNLSRIIEPYSKVQLNHVAHLIGLSLPVVEKKLSQMILDKKLNGILDQGQGILIIFEESQNDETYEAAVDIIQNLGKVVDSLYQKVKKLH